MIAGSADAVAIKAAKFAVSGMVPVVGGILSDAAETVLAGAAAVRSTAGVLGLLAILAITAAPFLKLGFQYLLLKKLPMYTAGLIKINFLKQQSTMARVRTAST